MRRLNRVNKEGLIYIGQRLKIPASTQSQVAGGVFQYKVRKGEWGCMLARRHGMTCTEFLKLNNFDMQVNLYEGQLVKIRDNHFWHVVQRGQTACGIASRYRINCNDFLRVNRLARQSTIRIGQRLRVPTG